MRVASKALKFRVFEKAKNTRKEKRLFVSVSLKKGRLTTTTLFPALVCVTRARERGEETRAKEEEDEEKKEMQKKKQKQPERGE